MKSTEEKSKLIRVTLESRQELGVLMIDEPGNSDVYEVVGRARRFDCFGQELGASVLLMRLKDKFEPDEFVPFDVSDYEWLTGTEDNTETGRKFHLSQCPDQGKTLLNMPIAAAEFLLFNTISGYSREVVFREDLFSKLWGNWLADAAGLTGGTVAITG